MQDKGFSRNNLEPSEERYLQAALDFRMHRFDEALNHVNAALEARPGWVPALRLRAGIYGEQGKGSEAIADLTRILNNAEDGSGHFMESAPD